MTLAPRQIALAVLLLIVLGVAGYSFYSRTGAPPAPSSTITLNGVCLACQNEVTAAYQAGQRQPAVCPQCHKRAVYATFYCPACQVRFVPVLEPVPGEPPRTPMIPLCPICSSQTVQGCMTVGQAEQRAKLAPLPAWDG